MLDSRWLLYIILRAFSIWPPAVRSTARRHCNVGVATWNPLRQARADQCRDSHDLSRASPIEFDPAHESAWPVNRQSRQGHLLSIKGEYICQYCPFYSSLISFLPCSSCEPTLTLAPSHYCLVSRSLDWGETLKGHLTSIMYASMSF